MSDEQERTSRWEHVAWCKARAAFYLDRGDVIGAWSSFASDMQKHSGTRDHAALPMGMQLLLTGLIGTVPEMRRWIEGFN